MWQRSGHPPWRNERWSLAEIRRAKSDAATSSGTYHFIIYHLKAALGRNPKKRSETSSPNGASNTKSETRNPKTAMLKTGTQRFGEH